MKRFLPHRNAHAASGSRIGGFTLLEVLIALLIFSVGMLGLAALQSFSVKTNQSAHFRSQAIMLSNMILDDMRANRAGVIRSEYYTDYPGTPPDCEDGDAEPTGGTASELDIKVWRWRIACQLPGGSGQITGPGNGLVMVSIKWGDARWLPAGERETEFQISSRL